MWVGQARKVVAPVDAVMDHQENAEPDPAPQKASTPPESVTRTIRGIVRDEQGRPVAKAWVGAGVVRLPDEWNIVLPLDRIRETTEPFRDDRGKVVPPGALGKYFELRDETGKWTPVHPDEVRRFQKPRAILTPDDMAKDPLAPGVPPVVVAAIEKGQAVFEVATMGRWQMAPESLLPFPADRTDPQGHFSLECTIFVESGNELHFASPDFSRRAIHVVRFADPDKAVEITLLPVRPVRARVVATPRDVPNDTIEWNVYAADPAVRRLDKIPAITEDGVHWGSGWAENVDPDSRPGQDRRFEVSLPAGRYKVRFWSDMVLRTIDLVVPPGEGPLDLPDFHLETLGWVQLLSKPAPEIEAVGLDDRPVKLADYRGKVVVVAFWTSKDEARMQAVSRLKQVPTRFKGQPLAILAVHNASMRRTEELKKALAPLGDPVSGEIPIRFLLDRPLNAARASEHGTGATAAAYQIWNDATTLVIDKDGRLAAVVVEGHTGTSTFAIGKVGELVRDFVQDEFAGSEPDQNAIDCLVGALQNTLGLPKSGSANHKAIAAAPEWPSVAKGKVVDLDGRPIARAKVSRFSDMKREHPVTTGPSGDFTYTIENDDRLFPIKVEAPGFASREFYLRLEAEGGALTADADSLLIEPSGIIPKPLKMGPGVTVAGRVVRDGKPVVGVSMGLVSNSSISFPRMKGDAETTTDERGSFRFAHVLANGDYWAYAQLGSLGDKGALIPERVRTTEDGSKVELGDLSVQPGLTFAGRVVCSDGKAVPNDILVTVWCEHVAGGMEMKLTDTGWFELSGLPGGLVTIDVNCSTDPPATGYRVSAQNKCRNPQMTSMLQGRVDHDIKDLTILLEPGSERSKPFRFRSDVDPALVADFNDAKAGPITGVPPRP